jgi:hypothetical protein
VGDVCPKVGEVWVLKQRAEGISLQHNYNSNSNRLARSLSKGRDQSTVNSSSVSSAERELQNGLQQDGSGAESASSLQQPSPHPSQSASPATSFRLSTYGSADSKASLRVALSTTPNELTSSDGASQAGNAQVQRLSRAISPRTSASSNTMSAQIAYSTANQVNNAALSPSSNDLESQRRSNPLSRNASSVRLGGYQPQPGQGGSAYQPQAYKPMPYQPKEPTVELANDSQPQTENDRKIGSCFCFAGFFLFLFLFFCCCCCCCFFFFLVL